MSMKKNFVLWSKSLMVNNSRETFLQNFRFIEITAIIVIIASIIYLATVLVDIN